MLKYDDNSIRQRKGADRIRLAPAAMLGSNGLDGAKHTVYEIIGNASDEKLSGYGSELDVTLYDDGSIGIRDYGRGVPLGWNDVEQNWNYFLVYEELYAGGKYNKNQDILKKIDDENLWSTFKIEDHPYLISIGLNGLGCAATQCSSEYTIVKSYRDGKVSTMEYRDGAHVLDELRVEDTNEPNGTFVRWKPDSRVFTDVNIPVKWFEGLCKSLSYVSGFDVILNVKGNITKYKSSNVFEQMRSSTGQCIEVSGFNHIRDAVNDVCICDVKAAIGPGGKGIETYHNYVRVSGGAHSGGINAALVWFFQDRSKEFGVRIKEVDYASKFSFIVSTLANKMSPRGQTKDSVDDDYVYNAISNALFLSLDKEYHKGIPWLLKVVDEVVKNAQNRIAVAEMSKSLKEIEKTTNNLKPSKKLITCTAYEKKQYNGLELFIVEGDSAGGKAIQARDSSFQCILQIRGKSLNLYKATMEQMIANKEVQDFIAAVGCGIDLGIDGYQSFDISKLRFDKIIILADADIDGEHINMLEFVKIFKLCPELIYNGYVYVAISPLYCINLKNNESVYCMTQAEMEKKREEIGEENIVSVDRFKGHGESDAIDLWNNSMNPATRNIMQIKVNRDDPEVFSTLELLFGKSTEMRKQSILGEILGTDYDETIENIENLTQYIESRDDLNEDMEELVVEY